MDFYNEMTIYCKHGCRYWYIRWISLVGMFPWFSTSNPFGIFNTFYLQTVIVEDIISWCKELPFGLYHIWHNGLKNVDRFLTIRKEGRKLRSYKALSRIVKSESNNVLISFQPWVESYFISDKICDFHIFSCKSPVSFSEFQYS